MTNGAAPAHTHTPGPWKVYNAPNQHFGPSEGWHVVNASGENLDSVAFVFDLGDARLIAALPDLLQERDRLAAAVSDPAAVRALVEACRALADAATEYPALRDLIEAASDALAAFPDGAK